MDILDKPVSPIASETLKELTREVKEGTVWYEGCKYIEIRRLQIDKRGSFGERFLGQCLYTIYQRRIKLVYADGDQGDWDLAINGKHFEIKTASLDSQKKFQNEGLKENGCYDGVLFLGIAPDDIYIKFVAKNKIPWNELHNREKAKTGRGHKWDFKPKNMVKAQSLRDVKNAFEELQKDME